jgi:hypothetical protein
MHELDEEMPARLVNGCSDLAPSLDMRGGVDAGRVQIALAVLAGLRALGDQQAETGTLNIIVVWPARWACRLGVRGCAS